MVKKNMKQEKKIYKRDVVILSISLFLFWLFISFDFSLISILSALIISIILSLLYEQLPIKHTRGIRKPITQYFFAIEHLIGLITSTFLRVILANVLLIYQAITLNINPKIVKVKVNLKSDVELSLISHLITLTPGTLVIDVEDADDDSFYLYVHFSYLKSKYLDKDIKNTIGKWDKMIGALFN
jgi:multicomponent Na+:H+ antiporter subunit E